MKIMKNGFMCFKLEKELLYYVEELILDGIYINREHYFRSRIATMLFILEELIDTPNYLRMLVSDLMKKAEQYLTEIDFYQKSIETIPCCVKIHSRYYQMVKKLIDIKIFDNETKFIEFVIKLGMLSGILPKKFLEQTKNYEIREPTLVLILSITESLINYPEYLRKLIEKLRNKVSKFLLLKPRLKESVMDHMEKIKEIKIPKKMSDTMIKNNIFSNISDFYLFVSELMLLIEHAFYLS